jgi:tetratricopeptide (TPR) repeat protein
MPSAPAPPGNSSITETWREPNFKMPLPAVPVVPELGDPQPLGQELRGPGRRKLPAADELELERALKGSGGRWPLMIGIGLVIGVGAGWYFGVYQPDQDKDRAAAEARVAADPAANRANADAVSPAQALEVFDAGAPVFDAGVLDAGSPVVDAGAIAPPVTLVEQTPKRAEPKMDFDALQSRGTLLLSQDKPEQALSLFGKALDLRPDSVEAMVGRGLSLLDLGNTAAAESTFEQAIKLNPRYGPGIMGLAEALRTQGKYEKAAQWYQRYLDVSPHGSEADVARNNLERLKK